LGGGYDAAVWEYAKAHEFVILSKYSVYLKLSIIKWHPLKIIWLRRSKCAAGR